MNQSRCSEPYIVALYPRYQTVDLEGQSQGQWRIITASGPLSQRPESVTGQVGPDPTEILQKSQSLFFFFTQRHQNVSLCAFTNA